MYLGKIPFISSPKKFHGHPPDSLCYEVFDRIGLDSDDDNDDDDDDDNDDNDDDDDDDDDEV